MIKAEGLDEAIDFLNAVGRGDWVKEPLKLWGIELVGVTKPYVSKPPQSTYRRTMNLSRQWYSNQGGNQVTVGNRAAYSGWVQQRATQAWMHRQHGWHTVEDRAESARMSQYWQKAVTNAVERLSRRYGRTF